MRKRILVVLAGLCACLNFVSCGGYKSPNGPSGRLHERVLASQGVSVAGSFGALVIVNGKNDTLPRVAPLSGGNTPGFIVVSPTRNIAATFDSSTNTVYSVNTSTESSLGRVPLPGATTSMVVPTANPTGFAAVPTATVNGFGVLGAVEALNFSSGTFTTIAVSNAHTVVSNADGTELLVFSTDSDSVTALFPAAAVPPVDTTCLTVPPNTQVPGSACAIVQDSRLSRPVNAIVNGNTAYILNCGFECGGILSNGDPAPASVAVFDLGSLTISQTIPVDAATVALLSGSTLYVAGTPANYPCPSSQNTAAANCGTLDVVDLTSMQVTSAAITDGTHDRIDLTTNGQIFVGARNCTMIGNVNNPDGGEIRGCLAIYKIADGSVIIPPDSGDVTGLQGFTTRNIEYVAEGGQLRVYDTTKDTLLINDFVPQGTIDIVGFVGDVKAIDFF